MHQGEVRTRVHGKKIDGIFILHQLLDVKPLTRSLEAYETWRFYGCGLYPPSTIELATTRNGAT